MTKIYTENERLILLYGKLDRKNASKRRILSDSNSKSLALGLLDGIQPVKPSSEVTSYIKKMARTA